VLGSRRLRRWEGRRPLGEAAREGQWLRLRRCLPWILLYRRRCLVGDRSDEGDGLRERLVSRGDRARCRERPRSVLDSSVRFGLAAVRELRSLVRPRSISALLVEVEWW
jgi:hypothetical protein